MLIICPPRITNFDKWPTHLPSGIIEFKGDFEGQKSFIHNSNTVFNELPKFGLFSTGTVNSDKLILYSNKNFEVSIEGIFSFFKNLNIKAIFSYPQPYHIFGLALGYLTSIINNWELFYPADAYSKEAHKKWLLCCEENGENLVTLGTPTHFTDAISFCKEQSLVPFESLTAIIGGAKVEKNLWHQLHSDLKIAMPSIGYGCSEASPGVTHLAPGLAPTEDGDLGTVLPSGKLMAVDNGFKYQGDNVCMAIIQNDEISFLKGEYLLSDLLFQGDCGHYYFKRRVDLVLNRGGEKFNLEEIESIIRTSFNCNNIAVGVEDQRLGQELGILFIGSRDLEAQILQKLREIYNRKFSARLIKSTDQLPINLNAKPDRIMVKNILKERCHDSY